MNKTIVGFLLGLVLGGGATWLYVHDSAPAASKAEPPKPEEKPNPLRLPPAKREQAGITLAKPESTTFAPVVSAYGRALDPSSLATLGAEIETARAALEASEKELARAKKLFAAGGNASAQTVETAEANRARDRAALNSAQTRLGATWGRQVAQESAAISAALAKGGALLRIDLLPGEAAITDAKEAKVIVPGRAAPVSAEIIGPAPVADAQVPGISFLALLRDVALPAGAPVRATLPGRGEPAPVLALPRSAVVYHQGSAWVFVLGEEDTFERKIVALGGAVGKDVVAILSGIEADQQVATTGAQQLLAAELQAGGAEEP